MVKTEKRMNKDLILREKLAIQRTHLANQTTLLSYLRTALYFFVAGLSIEQFFNMQHSAVSVFFFGFAIVIAFYGIFNFIKQRKAIDLSKKNIGDYKLEYLNDDSL